MLQKVHHHFLEGQHQNMYSVEDKLKKHEKVGSNHDYFYLEMFSQDNKISKYHPGEKPMKVSLIIYASISLNNCIHVKINLKSYNS